MPENTDINWNGSGTNSLTRNDITDNANNLKILVINTANNTPYFLPISVLSTKFLKKDGNDTMNGNLTIGDGNVAKNLIISGGGNIQFAFSGNNIKLEPGVRTATIEATGDRTENLNITSEAYLKISGGVEFTGYSVFDRMSIYPGAFSGDYSSISNRHYLLIGTDAAGVDGRSELFLHQWSASGNDVATNVTLGNDKLEIKNGVNSNLSRIILKMNTINNYIQPFFYIRPNTNGAGGNKFINYPLPDSVISILPTLDKWSLYVTLNGNDPSLQHTAIIPGTVGIQTSDDDLKTRKGYSKHTLEQITSIPVFEFYYNDDASKRLQIGTSAQSLKEVEPLIVFGDKEKGESYSVDYSKLGLIALEGIKLLKEENDALRKELSELKEAIEYMRMKDMPIGGLGTSL